MTEPQPVEDHLCQIKTAYFVAMKQRCTKCQHYSELEDDFYLHGQTCSALVTYTDVDADTEH